MKDKIFEAYKEVISEKKLDWQKVFNKPFKMKIGDVLSSRVEGGKTTDDETWYYTNYDYQIVDMWLEAGKTGDDTKFKTMVKVKSQNHGDKSTDVMELKEFEDMVNYPNG